ncbi:uncharacterized protein LOC132630771 [Lycium barbarum]|uniref:uncharacterized protein LOC132630771 n=1 Tax=Lycium barbarum TaxID=112863 RepID=UPI00293E5F4F|nr:uncharacterized protein LOC132630771 [Lycium barbarum]
MTITPDNGGNELLLREGDTQDPQEVSTQEDMITTLLTVVTALQEKVARNEAANADNDASTEGKRPPPPIPSPSSPMPDHFPIYPPGTIPPLLNPTDPNNVRVSYRNPQPVCNNTVNQPRVSALPTGQTTYVPLNHLTHQTMSLYTPNVPNESSLGHKELDKYEGMEKARRAEHDKRERNTGNKWRNY